jgi:type IV pilus assembly protein PilB
MSDQDYLQAINQEAKEKDLEKKAKSLNLGYVNLLETKVPPETLNLLSKQESVSAKMVVFFMVGRKIRVALSNPDNPVAKQILEKLKKEHYKINLNLASVESIENIQKLYQEKLYQEKKTEKPIVIEKRDYNLSDEISGFNKNEEYKLNELNKLALSLKATDLHLQPEKTGVLLRLRINGVLQEIKKLDFKVYENLLREITFIAKLKINTPKIPQDGQFMFKTNEKDIDVRVSLLQGLYGQSVVMRYLDPENSSKKLSELGYSEEFLNKIAKILTKKEGLCLVVGPTGSGKTTTLYSMLRAINSPDHKIITLEDPVEYKLNGVLQCEVKKDDPDLNFQTGLNAILRQDPDIIMLGEIREKIVAKTALEAALTGHLVFSTLHANSAMDTLIRLQNLGLSNYLLASGLQAIVFQKLTRTVCLNCAELRKITDTEKEKFERMNNFFVHQNLKVQIPSDTYEAKGCSKCNNTGYKGRIAVSEIIYFTPTLKKMLREEQSVSFLMQTLSKEEFIPFEMDFLRKIAEKKTTFAEFKRVY